VTAWLLPLLAQRSRRRTKNPQSVTCATITSAEYINLLSTHAEAGNALVAAGLVEDGLQELLLCAARPLSNTLAAKIFDGLGPLSRFSAKIEVAYIFRLLDEATYKDLLAIKDIRNRFAHTSRFVNFRSEEINTCMQAVIGVAQGRRQSKPLLGKNKDMYR
jgi:hypothetical protein